MIEGGTIMTRPFAAVLCSVLFLFGCTDPADDDVADDDDVATDDDTGDDDDTSDDDTGDDDTGDDDTGDDDDAEQWESCEDIPVDLCLSEAADWSVPHDFSTIRDAIIGASDGDEICVEVGTYNEHLQFNGRTLRVYGVGGPVCTLVEGSGNEAVADIYSGSVLTLEGLTLTGGGGGAVWGGGLAIDDSTVNLLRVIVSDNHVNSAFGGGMHADASVLVFTDVIIAGNSVTSGSGGGMLIEDSQLTMTNVLVYGNVANSGMGGGMRVGQSSTVLMTDVALVDNRANQGFGGGAYFDESDLAAQGLIVSGNTVMSGYGGGVFVDNGSTVLLVQGTFVGNSNQSGNGGGLHVEEDCTVILEGLVFYDNHTSSGSGGGAYIDPASPATISYCDFYGNTPNDVGGVSNPVGNDGNLSVDPMYLDLTSPDPLSWDLHLDPASSLIDAGDPADSDPDTSPADMGAYGGAHAGEFDLDLDGFPVWWQPGSYDAGTYPGLGWDCDDTDYWVFPGLGC